MLVGLDGAWDAGRREPLIGLARAVRCTQRGEGTPGVGGDSIASVAKARETGSLHAARSTT
eukprot:5750283-Prymnesium_polylepis.1